MFFLGCPFVEGVGVKKGGAPPPPPEWRWKLCEI